MADRKVIFIDPTTNVGLEQIDPTTDSIAASGFTFKETGNFITLDGFNNMIFKDGVAGTKTLTELVSGSAPSSENEQVSGQVGTTVTFVVLVYSFGTAAGFYRNGVRMRLVTNFSVGAENYSEEYKQVNGGTSSNQITLHTDHPAVVDDWFMLDLGSASSGSTIFPDVIVGTTAQVSAGVANFDSLQAAINVTGAGQKITYLGGSTVESITIDHAVSIFGVGSSAFIGGTVTFLTGGDKASITMCRFGDDVTIDSGVKYTIVNNNWLAPSKDIIDNSGNVDNLFSFNIKET